MSSKPIPDSTFLPSNVEPLKAVGAFRSQRDVLADLVQLDLPNIASKLYTKSIISAAALSEALNHTHTASVRTVSLLSMVEDRIRAEPHVFTEFVQILESEAILRSQASWLVEKYLGLPYGITHREVISYIRELDTTRLYELGGALGLNIIKLKGIASSELPLELCEWWLRGDDAVYQTSSIPTWSSLVRALRSIGANGLANRIERERIISPQDVSRYLTMLDTPKLYELGGELGLNITELIRIPTQHLPVQLCIRWLREDDDVHQTSGTPTWSSLFRAVRSIGANGLANRIELERLVMSETVKRPRDGSMQGMAVAAEIVRGYNDGSHIPGIISPQDVSHYFRFLSTPKLYELGGELGLNITELKRISSIELPLELCERWLREDDDVHQTSGTPTWSSLVKALRNIGANGLASSIEQEGLVMSETVKRPRDGSMQGMAVVAETVRGYNDGSHISGIISPQDVSHYFRFLSTPKLYELGGELGLNLIKLKGIASSELPLELCERWLREDDDVHQTSGTPTWSSLVKALRNIGANGLASSIEQEHPTVVRERERRYGSLFTPGIISPQDVSRYLRILSTSQLYELGRELGLNITELKRIAPQQFPLELCERWLREDDDVHQTSGTPTWNSLVTALRNIGTSGLANMIEQERLEMSETVKRPRDGSTQDPTLIREGERRSGSLYMPAPHEVIPYLKMLSIAKLYELGGELGLNITDMRRIAPEQLPLELCMRWLREDDAVYQTCGTPTWNSLVTALRNIGANRVASMIEQEQYDRFTEEWELVDVKDFDQLETQERVKDKENKIAYYEREQILQGLLMEAVMSGHLEVVEQVGKKLKKNFTHFSASQSAFKWMQKTTESQMLDFVFVDSSTEVSALVKYQTHSPLTLAAELGKTDMVERLVELGASLRFKNKLGVLSLHVACENGNAMMISCFLKAGEGPLLGGTHRSYNDHGSLVNAKGGEKRNTALMYAVKGGHIKVVEELVKSSFLLFDSQNEDGQNVYHVAAAEGQLVCLKYLCTVADKDLLLSKDKEGYTPAVRAFKCEQLHIVEYLIDTLSKQDLEVIVAQQDCLHVAASHYSVKVAQLLLEVGCRGNFIDDKGNTALHIAYMKSNLLVAELISIECKGLESIFNKNGKLPRDVEREELLIPLEIEKLGKQAVRLYYKALSEGKLKIPYGSLLVFGKEEVGKTSLIRQLAGLVFKPQLDRTRGIDNNTVDTVDSRNIDTETWSMEKSSDASASERFGDAVLRVLPPELSAKASRGFELVSAKSLLARLQQVEVPSSTGPQEDTDQHAATVQSDVPSVVQATSTRASQGSAGGSPASPKSDALPESASRTQEDGVQVSADNPTSPAHQDPSQPMEDSSTTAPQQPAGVLNPKQASKINRFVKGMESFESKEPSLIFNTLDFAGQREYKPMHHCFILMRALFLVVFKIPDMIKFLHSQAVAKYNPLDDITYWIRSIYAHICSSGDVDKIVKRVLIVGTYRDDPSCTPESLLKVDRYLKKELIEKKMSYQYINLIQLMNTEPECFIPVENSIDCERGDSYRQDSGIKLVQEKVIKMSESLSFLKEEHPITWLKLEERLKLLYRWGSYKEGDPAPIMDVKELKELARKSGIEGDDQQELALKFFHLTGKIIYLKYIPRLFLADEQYEKLVNLAILNPHWLMSMMKVIMELTTKTDEAIARLSNHQVLKLTKEGIADFKVLEVCWDRFLSHSDVTIGHLCLIFQAYCLIRPLPRDEDSSVSPSDPPADQKFLIPCKLPDEITDDRICKIAEKYKSFYFDFNEFLPDVIYHRLICLISTVAKPLSTKLCHHYSRQQCFFTGVLGTNMIIQMDEAQQRLRIKFMLRKNSPKKPYDYVRDMHNDYLFKICKESGLSGLDYFGGPQVACTSCDWEEVIPCVVYKSGDVRQVEDLQACSACGDVLNIEEWLPDGSSAIEGAEPSALSRAAGPLSSSSGQPKAPPPSLSSLILLKWKEEGRRCKFSLVDRVSSRWRNFGLLLDLKSNVLDGWNKQFQANSGECWVQVMQHWMDGGSKVYPATWQDLYDLVEDVGYPAVAKELKEAVEKT